MGHGPVPARFWKRASKIVLEANPGFREEYFDAEANDDVGREILAAQKGKRMPMVGRVEISIIEEDQPRWLSFVNGEMDLSSASRRNSATWACPTERSRPTSPGAASACAAWRRWTSPMRRSTWRTP